MTIPKGTLQVMQNFYIFLLKHYIIHTSGNRCTVNFNRVVLNKKCLKLIDFKRFRKF